MEEIIPGILHWTAFHDGIGMHVSSYYVEPARALIDPMLPEDGIAALERREAPERILLTNRHHYRHSARLAEAFGCEVLCHEAGLHEFEGGPEVTGFAFGDEVARGIEALEIDAICDEETALRIDAGGGAIAFADGLIRGSGGLSFVPDPLLGEDPGAVKRGLRDALERLLDREFEHLLFAHGEPLVGGRAALSDFIAQA